MIYIFHFNGERLKTALAQLTSAYGNCVLYAGIPCYGDSKQAVAT